MSTVPGEKGKKQKRSRIVVNVEDLRPQQPTAKQTPQQQQTPTTSKPTAASTRRARRSRLTNPRLLVPLGIIALVPLLLLLGTYFWWQSYKTRPTYALALTLDAARRDDTQAFEALVDVDSVSRSLVPQVVEQMRGAGSTIAIAPQVRRQIEANAQVLLPGARDQIRATLMTQIRDVLARSGAADDSLPVLALSVSRVA